MFVLEWKRRRRKRGEQNRIIEKNTYEIKNRTCTDCVQESIGSDSCRGR